MASREDTDGSARCYAMSAPGDSVWIKNPDSKSSDSFLLGVVDESEGDSRQVKLKGSSVQHKLRKVNEMHSCNNCRSCRRSTGPL